MYLPVILVSIARKEGRKALAFPSSRSLSGNSSMRILNVAEKNDAAKNIAAVLSGGAIIRRQGLTKFNPIYEFEYQIFGQNATMVMTAVKGHLLNYAFMGPYSKWRSVDPISLFEAPISKVAMPDNVQIKKTLEQEIKTCPKLIIWTDCDREGENIGFEVIGVCKAVRRDIEIYRAKFSEITPESIRKALSNLKLPDKHISNAVDVRSELDLRIGAAFTRFQTLYLQKAFPNALANCLVSYGTCQFPTLGFVVERFKAISEFKPEPFWQIKVRHMVNGLPVDFSWERNRLFDKSACEVLYHKCTENGMARVENIVSKRRIKWRPHPLDTVELQKMASKKFGMTAKETLRIAESLYSRGLISYPRTETNCFSPDIDLVSLVRCQTADDQWGEFAQNVLRKGPDPFQGKKSDQAHPPIHPIKHSYELQGNEKKIYEFVTRHFLACVSKNATGLETVVDIEVAEEKFSAKGLTITAKNYLEVYPYVSWAEKEIPIYHTGEIFNPEILMEEGETTPPELLTEADLISLMEKHGIGTDATHAEHIETVKARLYVGLQDQKYFVPRTLGMGLVEGYNNMGYDMTRPEMRAELEADLKRICENRKLPAEVLVKHIGKYKKVFEEVQNRISLLSKAIQSYIQVQATPVNSGCMKENVPRSVGKCPTCYSDLYLRRSKEGSQFIGCSAYPRCCVALWLPSFVLDVTPTTQPCPTCGPDHYMLRFKFEKGSCYFPPDYVGCIGGCDWNLLELLNYSGVSSRPNGTSTRIRSADVTVPSALDAAESTALQEINDSGFGSLDEGPKSSVLNCRCGVPAACLVVKKPGPNLGREFYKCGAVKSSSQCDFFQWKMQRGRKKATVPEVTKLSQVSKPPQLERASLLARASLPAKAAQEDQGIMRCYCSVPCRRLMTTKEGPNKGREFFTCGKSFQDTEKCKFFKWADDDENVQAINRTTAGNVRRGPLNERVPG